MSLTIAILGLTFLILVHEAGHFLASLAIGLRPRKFYVGFPPALVKTRRGGIEYGIGAIPLGGFVSIPGMHRPIAHDVERRFYPAVSEAPALTGPVDRVKRLVEEDDFGATLAALDDLEQALGRHELSANAASRAGKGLTELRDGLGSDAYWKAATWKRLIAIAAGPAANIVLALVVYTLLFTMVGGPPSRMVASVAEDSPAQAAGVRAGDRIVAMDGTPVNGEEVGQRVLESEGRPLVLTVVRDGKAIDLPRVAPALTDGGYRIGIVREGTGLALPDAAWRSVEMTGLVTREIVKAIGGLAAGQGRENVASPIGIAQVSSDAVDQGKEQFLWVLGLISLSLALLNLLPLLPLDGGHLLFTLIEGARGRFVKREVYERVSVVGLAIVLLLFVVGLSNDIGRLS
ncbi:MAG TPA: M50 family metallopeptidase [Gaiellaceae bacterium]|nr:M50 family metallopeptidase [Gaiellaceae bacterium]